MVPDAPDVCALPFSLRSAHGWGYIAKLQPRIDPLDVELDITHDSSVLVHSLIVGPAVVVSSNPVVISVPLFCVA